MDALTQTVRDAVFEYAGGGFNLKTFALADDAERSFAVLIADTPVRKRDADILVFARLEGEYVIIEADSTDYPLLDVLLAKGVTRDKIVFANTGEALPDMPKSSHTCWQLAR